MVISRSYKTDAVVLKRINFGETDKLVTVFTRMQGKKVLLAKGVRKVHSKKAPHLELFSHVSLFIHKGRNLDIVTEAYTIDSYQLLRNNLSRVAYAYKIVELLDRLCTIEEIHFKIYQKLIQVLKLIRDMPELDLSSHVDKFSLDLLWELGFLPKGKVISGNYLIQFQEEVMERNLKSNSFLTKLALHI